MNVIDLINIDTATKFIMPMVYKDHIKFSDIQQHIYSTHLSIYDKPEFDDKIIVVSSSKLDKTQYDPILLIRVEQAPEELKVLNIFNIPYQYHDDFDKCVSGRYSKLSDEYKERLLSFWEENENSKLYGTLYLIPNLRFGKNLYLLHYDKIRKAREYYIKPSCIELIYGITQGAEL